MINQPNKNSLNLLQQFKSVQFSQLYNEIIRKFDKQAAKVKHINSHAAFDDSLLSRTNKVLPKLTIETERKVRMKYYSNKLVINDSVYINEKKQYAPQEEQNENIKRKVFYNYHHSHKITQDQSVLSQRNKRIMDLYRRAGRNFQLLQDKHNKSYKRLQNHSRNEGKSKQDPYMESKIFSPPKKEFKTIGETSKRSIQLQKNSKEEIKRVQKVEKLELPLVKTHRSNSNILLRMNQNNPEDYTEQSLTCRQIEQAKEKSLENNKSKILNKIKYEPIIKKKFNWKNEPLPLNKIEKQEFYKLMRYYANVEEIIPIQSGFYKAHVGYGNNCTLIKKLLKDRGYWTIVDTIEDDTNFVWTQIRSSKYINQLPSSQETQITQVNRKNKESYKRLEQSAQLLNFIKLKKNQYISSCQKLLEHSHFLIIMHQIKQKFKKGSNLNNFLKLKDAYVNFLEEYRTKEKEYNKQIKANDIKLHNHIENSGSIGNKKSLLFMMTKFCEIFQEEINKFIPTTIHLENTEDFQSIFDKIPDAPWILKPGQSTNRGQGITVHTTKQSLKSEIMKKKKHKNGSKYTNIVQKYIQPLLYHGRKFDIRIWALWSGHRLWWYKEGYLRTSSKQFTLKSLNRFVHLTNDAIQSQSQDFGKYEPANKLSFNQFEKYLEVQYNYHGFYTDMLAHMKKIAVKAFRMGNLVFNDKNRKYNFELFGLDFLIDNNFKPWLIQCNTNPCLEINCSLLARLVPNMLQNMMNLTIDTYFPPPTKRKQRELNAWNHQTFKFELIYDGRNDSQIKQKMHQKGISITYKPEYEEQILQIQQKSFET